LTGGDDAVTQNEGLKETSLLSRRKKKPKISWVLTQADRLQKFWQTRNDIFEEDEELYKLQSNDESGLDTDNIGGDSEVVTINDPKVFADKVVNMLSSQEPVNNIPIHDPGNKDAVERVESMVDWWRLMANRIHMNGLHPPLSRDEHWYSCVRGWLAGRVTWNPMNPKFPWNYTLADPVNVFPQIGANGVQYVIHKYSASGSQILSDFDYDDDVYSSVEKALGADKDTFDPDDEFDVVGYYDDYYHVIAVNGEEIKNDETGYGFNPWVITPVAGDPIRATPWDKIDYVKYMGQSIYCGVRDMYKKLEKAVSVLATEVSKISNPPVGLFTDEQGQIQNKDVDLGVGGRNTFLFSKEKVEVMSTSKEGLGLLESLFSFYQDRINRGSIPPVLWGEGAGTLSGFAVSLLSAGARDVVYPRVRAMEHYRSMVYEKALDLYIKFGGDLEDPVRMVFTDRRGPTAGMRRTDDIQPDEVAAVGTYVEVTYRSLAPQDRAAMAQLAALLVGNQIISRDSARGKEFIGLENPTLENDKVLAEMIYMDQDTARTMSLAAAQRTDPKAYASFLNSELQKVQQALQQVQQQEADKTAQLGAARAAGYPVGQTPELKVPGAGLPPETLPPEMQGVPPPSPIPGGPANTLPLG
jgi:hypothetical protein